MYCGNILQAQRDEKWVDKQAFDSNLKQSELMLENMFYWGTVEVNEMDL